MTDEEIVRRQLGRKPRGFERVATRCPLGLPETIVTRPLVPARRGARTCLEPFPTVFWLTCPGAVKAVSQLEAEGRIGEFQERLAQDPEAAEAYRREVDSYADFRRSLLTEAEAKWLQAEHPSWLDIIRTAGIGGVLDDGGIKCLHAHYADYLARGANPIGRWVHELLMAATATRAAVLL